MNAEALSLLPSPAHVQWVKGWIGKAASREVFSQVMEETRWQDREILMFGKPVLQPRRVAWQGDPGKSYRYSGTTWEPDPWSPTVQGVRERLLREFSLGFNSVLLNLYRD